MTREEIEKAAEDYDFDGTSKSGYESFIAGAEFRQQEIEELKLSEKAAKNYAMLNSELIIIQSEEINDLVNVLKDIYPCILLGKIDTNRIYKIDELLKKYEK